MPAMGMNSNGRSAARIRVDPWLLPAALLSLIPILSLLRPGIAGTADGIVHLLRTVQVVELFRSGVVYPQWAPDFYFGYGYPFFLFYTPGVHLVTALFALTGIGAAAALVATQVVSLLLYSVGGYVAGREIFGGLGRPRVVAMAALAAAALYVYAPLRMRELFSQGNLSQLVALSLLPWCLWALLRATKRPSWRWTAFAALLLAGLLYAHHPSAFLAYPLLFALGLAVVLLSADRRTASAGALVASFALALALSAPFWLPWLLESSYGSLQRMETGFNAAANLVPADQLFSPSLVLDSSSINSPRPLTVGLAQALLAAAGAIAALVLLRRARDPEARRSAALLVVLAVLLLLCLLLMLPLAAPLWTHLPLAKFIAFPWRLLGPAGLLAALLGGVPLLLLPERPAFGGLLALLAIAPLSVAPYLFPAASLWRPVPAEGITLADIGRYEVSGGSRGTASANEYLPRWVEDGDPPLDLLQAYEAGRLPERLDTGSLPPGSFFETIRSAPLETIHRVNLPQAAPVTILRFYYPGWRAFLDGQPIDARPTSPSGFIQVDVPAGEHTLRVVWGQTLPRVAGFVLFGLGVAGMLALLVVSRKADRPRPPAELGRPVSSEPSPDRFWLAAAAFILLLTAAKALWIEPATSWFRLASPPDAPAGMTRALNLRYDNGVELMGYDLRADEARQGGELRLRLFWRATRPLGDDVRSFAHLDAPLTGITWANQTKDQPGEMPSRYWPPGFYVVDDFRLRIPADTPPVSADLTVGLLTRDAQSIELPDGRKQVALGEIAIRQGWQPFAQRPAARGVYRLGEAITLEGYQAEVSEREGRQEVALLLDWKTDRQLETDYTIFAQVFDAGGQMVGQLDGPACVGSCPSSRWTPEGIVEDARRITLREGTSPEGLRVVVGLYDPATGERLPVRDARNAELPERAIQIEVAPPRER
jgi:hypothetical protein